MTPKILFAGGGTAGHVEPALAVASWLRNVKPNWEYVFVGTKNGLENQLVPIADFNLTHMQYASSWFLTLYLAEKGFESY
jgi:UDP-N-acetylglucosamine--N-acetylmuramyl-(pentapeptide) pyrophosphoryl-undecaprenol N-acetylglucosamine transferase